MTEPLLVFDCDPGCDDALAIALVVNRQPQRCIDFLTVAGNVSVDQTTSNAARVLAACLRNRARNDATRKSLTKQYRIFRGCSTSLDGQEPSAASVHGRDGLGDAPNRLIWERRDQQDTPGKWFGKALEAFVVTNQSAVERYLHLARQDTPFDLLCTGPLTNLACALNLMTQSQQESFWRRCCHIVIMGGSFSSAGNITHSSEFNTFADPLAAHVVLKSFQNKLTGHKNGKRIHFVSLDTTEAVAVPVDADIDPNEAKASPASRFLLYALKQYGLFHSFHCNRPESLIKWKVLKRFDSKKYLDAQLSGGSGDSEMRRFCYLHDPLAAWVLLTGKCEAALWKTDVIRIDTSRGEGRGRVIICHGKDEYRPARLPVYGTEVKWLDPQQFRRAICLQFINEMATLLGISKSWNNKIHLHQATAK